MRILIVEDESKAAKRLARLTRELLEPEIPSILSASTITEGKEMMRKEMIDLLLLDLNLNGRNGFSLLKPILVAPFHTIVVSAYKDQAIHAFDHGVLDFVPKPVEKSRLKRAFDRYHGTDGGNRSETKFLAVKATGRTKYISIEDILFIKAANVYSEIVLKDEATILYEKSLDKVFQLLEPRFARIHKSYIVALDLITGIVSSEGSRYWATLKSGHSLPIGRTRVADIRKLL